MRPVLAVSRRLSSRRLDAERPHDRPIVVDEHDEPVDERSEDRTDANTSQSARRQPGRPSPISPVEATTSRANVCDPRLADRMSGDLHLFSKTSDSPRRRRGGRGVTHSYRLWREHTVGTFLVNGANRVLGRVIAGELTRQGHRVVATKPCRQIFVPRNHCYHHWWHDTGFGTDLFRRPGWSRRAAAATDDRGPTLRCRGTPLPLRSPASYFQRVATPDPSACSAETNACHIVAELLARPTHPTSLL